MGTRKKERGHAASRRRITTLNGELEALEPIDEEDLELPAPSIIDGIRVNMNPRSKEIKQVIDLKRDGPNRQTFYLAKAIDGNYYWFHSSYTNRNCRLRRLIRD